MKTTGHAVMRFIGQNSLGYEHGKEYYLEICELDFFERLHYKASMAVRDMSGRGQFCPYTTMGFIMNWENATPHAGG